MSESNFFSAFAFFGIFPIVYRLECTAEPTYKRFSLQITPLTRIILYKTSSEQCNRG